MFPKNHDSGFTRSRNAYVLIVEDNEDTCEVFELALRQHGFETRSVHCTEQALNALSERTPDIIVLDYFIPGNLSASDLVAVVHSRRLPSKMVLVSGVSNLQQEACSLKIEHAIQKPCDLGELLSLVERLTSASATR